MLPLPSSLSFGFYISALYFYSHIIAWQFMESYDGEGDYYGKKCNLFVQSSSTVGANVLQKEMRCMQWKRAKDPIGNRGKCRHLFEFSGTKFA